MPSATLRVVRGEDGEVGSTAGWASSALPDWIALRASSCLIFCSSTEAEVPSLSAAGISSS